MPPASVCLLRLSALGDVTHAVPVVRTLQREWPQTKITWIIGKGEHGLVADLPGVEFIPFDKRAGWRAFRDLRARLRGRRFDVLLLMQIALRANLLSLFVRADRRVGYDRQRARELHGWFVNQRVPAPSVHPQHVVDAFGSFLQPLGLQQTEVHWDIPIPREARAWAESALPGAQPTLVICPASSHPRRNWNTPGYAAVATHATQRRGFRIVLAGGRSERERRLADEIRACAQVPTIDLVGQTNLKQLLALLARATVVLAPDSGPMHVANAAGTPVIGLHAATHLRRSGPYSDTRFCVDRFAEAVRRFRRKTPADLRWGERVEAAGVMDLITSDEVIAAFERFVASRSPLEPS